MPRFGRQVLQRRQAYGLSQAELAKRSGTTQAAISRIEAGEGNPTVKTMAAISEVLRGRLSLNITSQPKLAEKKHVRG